MLLHPDPPAEMKQPNANAEQSPEARDARSDCLKGVAIIGVVSLHASLPYADVFRFCVPVFIALWAFHYERGLARRQPGQVWLYVTQRFVRLLTPYVFWTVLYFLLFQASNAGATALAGIPDGGWFGGNGWPGQYFFIILFQLTWLMPLLRRWVAPQSLGITLAGGAILNASAGWWLFSNPILSGLGDRLCVYWLPYVFLGVAFARGYPRAIPGLLPLAIVSLSTVPYALSGLILDFDKAGRVSPYLVPAVTLGSIALLLAVGPRLPPAAPPLQPCDSPISRALAYIGRHSLAIFVANPLILEASHRLGIMPDNSPGNFPGKAVLIAVTIGASLALGWCLRRLGLGMLVGQNS